MTEIIKHELDQDGIALLTIDLPGKSMNIISAQLLDELEELVGRIAENDDIKGAVITSGKKGSFVAGADLDMLLGMTDNIAGKPPEEIYAGAYRMNGILR
ncbi:MAG: enoyl-CoA hydratase-related protein, partial [Emcibacter sp.]|nr:enoyl-CoA hydratase-related protein [Emcibacter sp.]